MVDKGLLFFNAGCGSEQECHLCCQKVFHERASTPTDGDKTTLKTNECVVHMQFKLQPCNIQETLVGLLGHCLSVLQERDKSACILNRRKTLEAKRVSDLPREGDKTPPFIIFIFIFSLFICICICHSKVFLSACAS